MVALDPVAVKAAAKEFLELADDDGVYADSINKFVKSVLSKKYDGFITGIRVKEGSINGRETVQLRVECDEIVVLTRVYQQKFGTRLQPFDEIEDNLHMTVSWLDRDVLDTLDATKLWDSFGGDSPIKVSFDLAFRRGKDTYSLL